MAFATLSGLSNCGIEAYPNFPMHYASGTTTTGQQINATGEKTAVIFTAPAAGDITKIGVGVKAAATPQTIKVSLQGVDSSGNPDGSIKGSGTAKGTFTPSANTYSVVTLDTPLTVTAFQALSVVCEFDSTVGDVYIGIVLTSSIVTLGMGSVYPKLYTGSWTSPDTKPCLDIIYSGDVYKCVWGAHPQIKTGGTLVAFGSGSNPDEVGTKFVAPFTMRCIGITALVDPDYACDLVLYDGTTSVASGSISTTQRYGTNRSWYSVFFDSITLTSGTTYRAVIKPTSASTINRYDFELYDAAQFGSLPWGNCQQTKRVNAGSWDDSATTLITPVAVLYDAIDVTPAGGGSGGNYGY